VAPRRGLGNHRRHAYRKVDAETLWNIHVSGELSALRAAVVRISAGAGL